MGSAYNIAKFSAPDEAGTFLDKADLIELTRLLAKYAPHDDSFSLTSSNIQIVRSTKLQSEQTHTLSTPSICVVPQGAKAVSFGQDGFEYDESKMVVYAASLPIRVKITQASKEAPYYCMVIPIDPIRLHDSVSKVFPNGVPKSDKTHAVYVGETNPYIFKSAMRVMTLIEQQENTDLLVPLAIDEILIRLLSSPMGPSLAQIGLKDSNADKVSRAISWLKDNFKQPIRMDDLAKIAGMSSSAFHTQFKSITNMTPLQFQKTLRLQEARSLIRTQMMDIGSASSAVGYISPTQFSREYSREFGVSPSRDGMDK